jgi:surfactin synthase thioesterase subunit
MPVHDDNASTVSWARCVDRRSLAPAVRLICFPFAGAGASIYQDWLLPAELNGEVWAVRPPGREGRHGEPDATRLEELVAAYATHLVPLLDRPFAFFGHSLGALAAYEVTRLLRRRGGPLPAHLFVSAFRAPHLPPSRPAISPLDDARLVERLLRMAGPSPSSIRDPELLLFTAPSIRADCALIERYVYRAEPPLPMPLTAFGAGDDCEVDLDEVSAWSAHTAGRFRMRELAGGHLFVRDLAGSILTEIASALVLGAYR